MIILVFDSNMYTHEELTRVVSHVCFLVNSMCTCEVYV